MLGWILVILCVALFVCLALFKNAEAASRKVSCLDMASIIGKLSQKFVDDLFACADLSAFETSDINIAKGYFSMFYSTIALLALRTKQVINAEQMNKIFSNYLCNSLGVKNKDFGKLVFAEKSSLPNIFVKMFYSISENIYNEDFDNLPDIIHEYVDDSIYTAVNDKLPIRSVIAAWFGSGLQLAKDYSVTQ